MIETHAFVFWSIVVLAVIFMIAVVGSLIVIHDLLQRIYLTMGWRFEAEQHHVQTKGILLSIHDRLDKIDERLIFIGIDIEKHHDRVERTWRS